MLNVNGLKKSFPLQQNAWLAINDVSFKVEQGEFFTLLGPSGCGKTTTLRCVAGLETPTSGDIHIGGESVFSSATSKLVPTNRRNIAMVFQSYAIWPHMTVFENVAFPLEVQRLARDVVKKRVMEALEMVGLGHVAERSATLLSGGQQQRVALARAVVKDSKLILLDEPLSNLDAELRVQMRSELRQIQRRLGTTAIYVTHDQEEAMSMSDRIAVMANGQIVELDTPDNLYLRPRTSFTARFIGQADLMECSVSAIKPGAVHVTTPIGSVAAGVFHEPLPRQPGLLIRPEHVEILAPDAIASTENVFEGRIKCVTFLGKLIDYQVEVGGHTLRVQNVSTQRYARGDVVRLRLPVERCVLVKMAQ